MPLPYIKRIFQQHKFFAPTYIRLDADTKLDPLPYKPKVSAYKSKGKSRALSDDEIDKEKAWLMEELGNSFRAVLLSLAADIFAIKLTVDPRIPMPRRRKITVRQEHLILV
jgi:hypothetical protein